MGQSPCGSFPWAYSWSFGPDGAVDEKGHVSVPKDETAIDLMSVNPLASSS